MGTPVQYTSRREHTYTLYQGTTQTGKPSYFLAMEDRGKGTALEAMPEGYVIYENPNAQVFLRRKRPRLITEFEEAFVKESIRKLAKVPLFKVDIRDEMVVVYTAEGGFDSMRDHPLLQLLGREGLARATIRSAYYTAVLRFELVDDKKRLFSAQRFCFLGSVDNWIYLDGPKALRPLVEKYVPHLGQDSFYDIH